MQLSDPYSPQPVPPSTAATTQSGCLNGALFAVACVWAFGVTLVLQVGVWFFDQYQLVQGSSMPTYWWVVAALVYGILLGVPFGLLAYFTHAPWFRAAALTALIATGFSVLLSLARLNPVTWTQPAAVVQIVLSLLAIAGLLFVSRGRVAADNTSNAQSALLAVAIALGLVIIMPWIFYGALGSILDTLLDVLAAAMLGVFAGVLIDRFLLVPVAANSRGPFADVGFSGVAAGIVLFILGAGFGYGGSQLPLMFSLLPLGGGAAVLGLRARTHGGRGGLALAGIVATVAAGPLLFLDPDEYTLALDDGFGWVARAFLLTMVSAAVIGLVLWMLAGVLNARRPRRAFALGGLAAALLVGGVAYVAGGRPGFYGERLFVIMRDQADLSGAAQIGDVAERRRFVYTTLTTQANTTQTDIRASLDRFGIAYTPYYLVNAIEVDGGPFVRLYLSSRSDVARIIDSPHLRPLQTPPRAPVAARPDIAPADTSVSPEGDVEWNISAIDADRVWDELNVRGKGIVLGESDSGVDGQHPALRDGYRGRDGQNNYNWWDPWYGSTSPVDVGGHGTHTTGTAVGRGGIGVAPDAQWIGCVNLGRNLGNPPLYLDCMQFMLAPFPQNGNPLTDGDPARAADVLNNSWGCPPLEGCDPTSLEPAVNALRAAGIFVVASAGNDGPACGTIADPIALYDSSFSVGAIDRAGELASFSSRGPVTVDGSNRVKPDIVAPGVDVRSSLPGGAYGSNDGTSMAGPHVAGVVALMWSAQPKLVGDIDQTEQILRDTARPFEGQLSQCGDANAVPNDSVGYGVVDAYAAVQAAMELR